jgi:single-strand DNA-binding protein
MVNKVFLLGRLGRKPEVKFTQSGFPYSFLSLAIDSNKKDKEGNYEKITQWISVKVLGKTAENCAQYLDKGRQVFVEAKLSAYELQDKDGNKIFKLDVVADNVQFLGSGEKTEKKEEQSKVNYDFPDDEVPF